jgi:hypothetical protein
MEAICIIGAIFKAIQSQNVLRDAARRAPRRPPGAALPCKLSKLSKSSITRFTELVRASWK